MEILETAFRGLYLNMEETETQRTWQHLGFTHKNGKSNEIFKMTVEVQRKEMTFTFYNPELVKYPSIHAFSLTVRLLTHAGPCERIKYFLKVHKCYLLQETSENIASSRQA